MRAIWGLLNAISEIIPLISHIHSYPPACSHLHRPSLCCVHHSTIIAEQYNGCGRAQVILVTVMWYLNWDEMLRSSYRGNQDKTRIRAGSKSYLLCYTREWVKREEKEILQHQTTSLYIHLICHPWIISDAPMYHPNILPWSYTSSTQFQINITTPGQPTLQHHKPHSSHQE